MTELIRLLLHLVSDPYQEESESGDSESEDGAGEDSPAERTDQSSHIRPMLVDIDLDLSALANATRSGLGNRDNISIPVWSLWSEVVGFWAVV